jgi:UDP-3-O-[3-hydroxymyristoyl] glucosamine N-acyltransferase
MDAKKRFTLREIAELTGAKLIGNGDHSITGVETLENASAEDASFLANPRYASTMHKSSAGVICIDPNTLTSEQSEGKNFLVSDSPSRTFQQIVEIVLHSPFNQSGFSDIHPTAVVHPSAHIGKNVQIGPYAVIDQGSTIGDRTSIGAHVFIGAGVSIGSDCTLYSHVTVRERCILGNRVILQPSAVIGSCGFGFTTDAKGAHTKLKQLGIVIIEDDVEIGACCTIDRARFKATRIGKGTKIDNLVQIGHNVSIGENNIIVSQTGIAGSSKTGRNVVFGGQAGVVGHVEITDNVFVATRGGVSKSITEPGKYNGGPVMPLIEYNRQQVYLRKIAEYVKRIEALEAKCKNLSQ